MQFVTFPDSGLIVPANDVRDISAMVTFNHTLGLTVPSTADDVFTLKDTIEARIDIRLRRHSDQHSLTNLERVVDESPEEGEEDEAEYPAPEAAEVTPHLGIVLFSVTMPFQVDVEPFEESATMQGMTDEERATFLRPMAAYKNFLVKLDAYNARLLREEASEAHPPGVPVVNVTEEDRTKATQAMERLAARVQKRSYEEEPSMTLSEVYDLLRPDPSKADQIGKIQAVVRDAMNKIFAKMQG